MKKIHVILTLSFPVIKRMQYYYVETHQEKWFDYSNFIYLPVDG